MTDTQRAAMQAAVEALDRAAVLLNATDRFFQVNEVAAEDTVIYDEATCDGGCLGGDCRVTYDEAVHAAKLLQSALAEPDGWLPIIEEIKAERTLQDEQWGGPTHDDEHEPWLWLHIIEGQITKHKNRSAVYEPHSSRIRLVKIAALALAGLESFSRKYPSAEEKP